MADNDTATWSSLAPEIRLMVLDALISDGCRLAHLVTVSREWQSVIEPHIFSRITLTVSRLADLNQITHRNRHLVKSLYLAVELETYDCMECKGEMDQFVGLSYKDNRLVTTCIENLFSSLSTWEQDKSNLMLDISVYSPSDSEHWFKYLTFEPDISIQNFDQYLKEKERALHESSDRQHGWNAACQESLPKVYAIETVFQEIMGEGPFDSEEEEFEWWSNLPFIPAVTGIRLRQQTRRRWKPAALERLFSRFPRLEEIHHEPWREWDRIIERFTDSAYERMFKSLPDVKRLVLFENFNQEYPARIYYAEEFRIPSSAVGRAIGLASLKLDILSASFILDAADFFTITTGHTYWPFLTSLSLTSNLLMPDASTTELSSMLELAASAAKRMPKLRVMEIWNGRKGVAAVFRYQRDHGITWRATWDMDFESNVKKSWKSVWQMRRSSSEWTITKEVIGCGKDIQSHGDAIIQLQLINEVLRPISLQQIQIEHKMRAASSVCMDRLTNE
ncbi:unnamed protein product [Clonostachys byssicola]|uniref:DUF6546 domain-containing protein n=1 Tax=Clonostachys byssicola TaxID=160290 RepID=A0A9N9UNB1_9HYPO|nr:unnamed protein product [Clonostachys byssicola]